MKPSSLPPMSYPILRKAFRPRALSFILPCLLMAGCASLDEPFIPQPLIKPPRPEIASTLMAPDENLTQKNDGTAFYQTPKPPAEVRVATTGRPAAQPMADDDEIVATVTLDNMPLPQFINTIYGAILKRNISIDAQVAQRTETVTFRTGKPLSSKQIFAAAQSLLRSYGIAVQDYTGTLRAVPENNQAGMSPEIRRGRAQPEVPANLRPVFFLAELEHVQTGQVSNWLRTLFQNRLTIQDDQQRNAILLSGQSDTVASALETIQILDQPLMRGRLGARITPVFWSADEMARRLVEILQAEGYSVSSQAASNTPTLLLPVGPVNSIIVFASNEQMLNHILRWAQDLDQSPKGRAGNFINYHVRNTDAAELAKTLSEVMGGTTGGGAAGGAPGNAPAARPASSRVVVNPAANSLIIQTTPTEFQQWYGLLQELDRPARNALIMATVAEVRLTEDEQFGFLWLIKQFTSHGYLVNTGISSAVGTKVDDGTFRVGISSASGDPRALLTALASSNKIRILSNPSVMARNGQDATIQVGQEVPILTSQISNADTGSSTGGIQQTIQYRNTGVILRVKPVIHSGGRIDLDISQEVSAAQKNETGVNSSPVILTRRIETKLTVSDGNTLLLGGLMQEQRTSGNAGIPFLKDIPYMGNLFRTSVSDAMERTELVILLTPYVIEDDFDAQAITESFRNQFTWASTIRPENSLIPPTLPVQPKREPGQPALPEALPLDTPAPDTLPENTIPPDNRNIPNKEASPPLPPSSPTPSPVYQSKPYTLPPEDAIIPKKPLAPVSPEPAWATEYAPPPAPTGNTPPAADTPLQNIDGKSLPPGVRPVTDEALKRELLEFLKR